MRAKLLCQMTLVLCAAAFIVWSAFGWITLAVFLIVSVTLMWLACMPRRPFNQTDPTRTDERQD